MKKTEQRIETLAGIAAEWRDSDYGPRRRAIEETLEAPNRWTEPALEYALDRWMERLTVEALEGWVGDESADRGDCVGVLHGEEEPLSGLRDALAAWALGFNFVGTVPDTSPALLPAIGAEVSARLPEVEVAFTSVDATLERADVIVAAPSPPVDALQSACGEHGLGPGRRLLRAEGFSVGVVDGHESDDEMERLAEDMLLYEGYGRRRLAVVWAPTDHAPDPYLEAMARFRGLFPAHEDTPGALQMQQAFLEARDAPHAYAAGLEFLVSRGEPDVQAPGHVRWAEYTDLDEVGAWWASHRESVYAVVARSHLHGTCPEAWPLRTPGGVHIPPLDDEEGRQVVRFLKSAGA
ncbi:MAG: hypothetical protein ABEL97_08625 [Salinibacter sp.]